jgi:hypothetical protein
MGRWVDVVLGIWWCSECGEEIWVTEGVDDDAADQRGTEGGVDASVASRHPVGLPGVRADAADGRAPAGASVARAPGDGFGWRDREGGSHLWQLILEAFGRAAP